MNIDNALQFVGEKMSPMNCPVCDKPTWNIMGALHEVEDIIAVSELHRVNVTFKPHECERHPDVEAQ